MTWMASVWWQDGAGRERATYIPSALGAPGVFADLLSLSGAFCTGQIEGQRIDYNHTPTDGVLYDDVGYVCLIDTQDFFDNHNRIVLPAPRVDVLEGNLINLDASDPEVLLLGAVSIGLLASTISGSAITSITPGWVLRNAYGARDTYQVSAAVVGNIVRQTVWVDVHGNTTATRLFGTSSPGAVQDQLEAMSNAAVLNWWESVVIHPFVSPASTSFLSVTDAVSLYYRDASGNRGSLTIPCPVETMFYADMETVNLGAAVLAPLLADGLAELVVESSGQRLAAWIGGRRQTSSRKLGI